MSSRMQSDLFQHIHLRETERNAGIVFSSSSSSGLITEHEPHRLGLILYTLPVDSVMKPHSCILQHVLFALLRYVRAYV